jgi:pimeloyl-ACP methyl ester carboxylesterase
MYEVDEFYVGDQNPMYVQRWHSDVFDGGQGANVVLVHSGAHTGVSWTTCPDGRPGWAKLFADAGRTVYVLDWPGMGRSRRRPEFLTQGAQPVVDAISTLLAKIGTSIVIGHSMGVPLSAKAIEASADNVAAFIAVAPAPLGNIDQHRPWAPTDRPLVMSADYIARYFTNSDRFPHEALDNYLRSTWDLSPTLTNASANLDHSGVLVVDDIEKLTGLPSLVVASEQDALTPPSRTIAMANFLNADHIVLGADWGLAGFGHMMPIEKGNELITRRLLDWLAAKGI